MVACITSKTDGDAFMTTTPKQYISDIIFERLVGFDAQFQIILLPRVCCKSNVLVIVKPLCPRPARPNELTQLVPVFENHLPVCILQSECQCASEIINERRFWVSAVIPPLQLLCAFNCEIDLDTPSNLRKTSESVNCMSGMI